MVKSERFLSDKVRQKKTRKKQDLLEVVRRNPFEIKVNKSKHNAIGKKLTKFDKGIPGVSRSQANKKRQNTLLVELKNKWKTNSLVDNRIGEKTNSLSVDEKITQRLVKQRTKSSSVFNLDEDGAEYELTHMGQSLAQIERFNAPMLSDDDNDDEEDKKISGESVKEAHFGGGILQKAEGDSEPQRSFKDKMEEIIAKSKLAKHERKTEQEEVVQMTDQLDDEWRQLHNLVASNKRKDDDEEHKEVDTYDIAVNSLKFESRGTPTDRLRTEEEQAKIEKEKLDKLEKERVARMRHDTSRNRGHRSADDLDDGMDYGQSGDEDFMISYNDGKLISKVKASEDNETEASDDDADGAEEEDGDGTSDDEEGDEEDDSDGSEDSYSDLESESDDESEGEDGEISVKKVQKKNSQVEKTQEIPYTFAVPEKYELLVEELTKYKPSEQNLVIERMRKCNHPSLSSENRAHLVRLYGFLFEYFGEVATKVPVEIDLIDFLSRHLYEMAKQTPYETAQHSRRILLERQQIYSQYCQSKGGRGVWPFLDLLFYFKLIGSIYPTSDFKHEVVTPAMLFASQIYSTCHVTNHRDVSVGLFLSTVMCEYVSFSKALMPECINFLSALLYSAVPSLTSNISCGTSSAKPGVLLCKANANELRSKKVNSFNLNQVIVRGNISSPVYNTDEFVLSSLWTAGILLKHLISLYTPLPSAYHLFESSLDALNLLKAVDYPEQLQSLLTEVRMSIDSLRQRKLSYVCKEKKKPKVLRMYEPTIEENFEVGKKKINNKQLAEKKKLKHQHKKEMKSAVREIRKDRSFIAEQNIKERMKRDSEREKKTNKILADLQGQQYEINMYNKMTKTKRKK